MKYEIQDVLVLTDKKSGQVSAVLPAGYTFAKTLNEPNNHAIARHLRIDEVGNNQYISADELRLMSDTHEKGYIADYILGNSSNTDVRLRTNDESFDIQAQLDIDMEDRRVYIDLETVILWLRQNQKTVKKEKSVFFPKASSY